MLIAKPGVSSGKTLTGAIVASPAGASGQDGQQIAAQQSVQLLTSAVVSKHSAEKDCWMIIGGKVYDVTGYIPMHPGGSSTILPYCGKDATAAFAGVGHSSFAKSLLQKYYVADLNSPMQSEGASQQAGQAANSNPKKQAQPSLALSPSPAQTTAAPPPVVPPAASPPPMGTALTADVVAQHSSVGSCWLIISGKVYDVTGYIPFHPGGQSTLTHYCGKNATTAFAAHSANAHSLLQGYYIGNLAASAQQDNVRPVITMLGQNPATVVVGSVYVDAGASATDNVDGFVTASIVKSGLPVSTSMAGTFTISYYVSDSSGNTATATRVVNVVPPASQSPQPNQTNQTNESQNSTLPVFTSAIVALHSSASSCWVIYDAAVYNITAYIPFHPGGQSAILPYCGGNVTVAFEGLPHSVNAHTLLQNYYIGVLAASLSQSNQSNSPLPVNQTNSTQPPLNQTNATLPLNQTNSTQLNPANSTPYYSAAQVSQHSTASSCWIIYAGKVYNITAYIPFHPGGQSAILPYCGNDATAAFDSVGHSNNAQNLLQAYFIGIFGTALPSSNGSTPPSNSTQTNSTQTGPQAYTININSAGTFNQTSLSIRPGDAVRFYYTNPGSTITITFAPSPPSSMALNEERRSRNYTFTQPGTWVFGNSRSSSQGTIVVQ